MKTMVERLILVLVTVSVTGILYGQGKVTVAVAANMQYPMNTLKEKFEAQTNIKVEIILSSSGKLTQQIQEGAPYDVFISADTSYPQTLYRKGFAVNVPKVYAKGLLVLWTVKDGINPSRDLKILLDQSIKKIAIANPKTAPYGVAAEQVLKKYNLYASVQSKLVFGESITQTNQFITSQSADIGFTAKSVVLSPEMKDKGGWVDVDLKAYTPIEQAAIILKHGAATNKEAAQKFYDYLYSKTARDILQSFGYLIK